MSVVIWLSITLIIFVLIMIILLATGVYKQYKPSTLTPSQMADLYTPTNPWSWDATHTAIPVDGLDGKCNVYTFTARDRFAPAVLGYTAITGCTGGCAEGRTCVCSAPLAGQTCIDDDQVSAQKMKHTCQQTNADWQLRTSGYCMTQDGRLVPPGTTEEFFTHCTIGAGPPPDASTVVANAGRCPGTLGLVAFNANITALGPAALDTAQCLQEPQYTVRTSDTGQLIFSNLSPLTTAPCDMRISYKGYPSELFRIQRATFDGANFVPSQTGDFARLIHRPTGYAVAPTLRTSASGNPDMKAPVVNAPLQLLPRSIGSDGYWWYLSPQRQDPNYVVGQPVRLIARAQLVYIPDPRALPSLANEKAMWTYLTTPTTLSVIPSAQTQSVVPVITTPFITVNGNAPPSDQTRSQLAQAMYIDYAIAQLITQGVQNFDFNGPFRFA